MQQPTEQTQEKIFLTQREEDLLTILKKLIFHIRAHDANGEVSRDFCMGCERNRTLPCVLPDIHAMIDDLEARRGGGGGVIQEKPRQPGQLNPPFGWSRLIDIRRVGQPPMSSTTIYYQSARTPISTLSTAIKSLIGTQILTGKIPNGFDVNRELPAILDDLLKLGIEIYEHKAQGLFEPAGSEPMQ